MLAKEGWEKRSIIDEPRLSEVVEMYESLDFEVLLEPVDLDSEECSECMRADPKRYKVIYTRPKENRKRCTSRLGNTPSE